MTTLTLFESNISFSIDVFFVFKNIKMLLVNVAAHTKFKRQKRT